MIVCQLFKGGAYVISTAEMFWAHHLNMACWYCRQGSLQLTHCCSAHNVIHMHACLGPAERAAQITHWRTITFNQVVADKLLPCMTVDCVYASSGRAVIHGQTVVACW